MTVSAARSNPETPKDSFLLVFGSFEEYSAQVHALKTNQMHALRIPISITKNPVCLCRHHAMTVQYVRLIIFVVSNLDGLNAVLG
jgi:hypothetical protein